MVRKIRCVFQLGSHTVYELWQLAGSSAAAARSVHTSAVSDPSEFLRIYFTDPRYKTSI